MANVEKINVGVICKENPHDRRPQSGTTFQVFRALSQQKNLNVFWIPFNDSFFSKLWLNMQKAITKLFHVTMAEDRSPLYIRLKEKTSARSCLQKQTYCIVRLRSLFL